MTLGLTTSFTLLNRKRTSVNLADNPQNERVYTMFNTLSLDYRLKYGLSTRLALPMGVILARSDNEDNSVVGLGDLSWRIEYDFKWLYRKRRRLPNVRIGLGISFPTGKKVRSFVGNAPTKLAIGHGTFDLLASLHLAWEVIDGLALTAHVSLQKPLHSGDPLTLGTVLGYGGGVYWQFWRNRMGAGFSIESEHVSRSREKTEGVMISSGSDNLYLVGSLSVRAVKSLWFALDFRGPVYQFINGTQLTPRVSISLSISYRFDLGS